MLTKRLFLFRFIQIDPGVFTWILGTTQVIVFQGKSLMD